MYNAIFIRPHVHLAMQCLLQLGGGRVIFICVSVCIVHRYDIVVEQKVVKKACVWLGVSVSGGVECMSEG